MDLLLNIHMVVRNGIKMIESKVVSEGVPNKNTVEILPAINLMKEETHTSKFYGEDDLYIDGHYMALHTLEAYITNEKHWMN